MRRFGEYELLQKIGQGRLGAVWMGRRFGPGEASETVAVQVISDLVPDPEGREMFFEEARRSMLPSGANVVQVFDTGEVDGEYFIVMEWVDGVNLFEFMCRGSALPTHVAAHVIHEVLRGLADLHSLHDEGDKAVFVHGDVSPQEVLCSVSGDVKLANFGLARLTSKETSGVYVRGKLRYIPPEQLRGDALAPAVDLYAVGAVFHELLSGRRFRASADVKVGLSGEYSPLPDGVPVELAELCTSLLEPDPNRRIASAGVALELLAKWPGYRNAATDLARLVRKQGGIEGPRPGPST